MSRAALLLVLGLCVARPSRAEEPPATEAPASGAPAPEGHAAGTPAPTAEGIPPGSPVSPPWGPPRPTHLPPAGPTLDERAGLFGLGLGLELPIVGMVTGAGTGPVQYGYTFGGALSTEIAPAILVRGLASFSRTYGGEVGIAWQGTTGTLTRRQAASSWNLELGGGLAYELRVIGRDLTPFVGVDAAAAFAGYRLDFAADDPLTTQTTTPPVIRGRSLDVHEAFGWSWTGSARIGMRFTMLRWLASEVDLRLSYWPAPGVPITNTYTSLDVRTLAEPVWLLRTTFSVRLGI